MSVAEIGIIGGSGFYQLLQGGRELTVQTAYGATSDVISVGEIAGRDCAFIPRHGRRHRLPPHMIPYRANIFALKELGVTQIIGVTAVGALTNEYKVGDFVFGDQLVDFTHGKRNDTFYDGPITTHIGFAEPFCPAMRRAAVDAAAETGIACRDTATIVVTNGPRFSTRAESAFFAAQGWHLENMTQYPEAVLARELTLSYLNVSVVTNSHVNARETGEGELANAAEVVNVFEERMADLLTLLQGILRALPAGNERPEFIRNVLEDSRWV
jgi:5'-methylthioadenosine phosphorylase